MTGARTAGVDRVLVANRGEIAVRVLRTLRRLGIASVAVYSDADAGGRHVREADVAVHLGPAAAHDSYLHVGRLLDAAAATGADAVHPGYGFLAENAAFARACAAAGLTWIGPPPAAIEIMGDKIRAKATVAASGVPVVPGRAESAMTDADLAAAAAEVGYPVLLKPSAGGGGKGMRLVAGPGELAAAVAGARRESAASFGDDTLFVERFVERPRHIEVQVLADTHGATIHLGERECSLQRRHQKVVEEAPSPLLDAATRHRIGEAACATAAAVGYTGAGTVEFIVGADRPGEYFFMEMNTRLQVEHPVTEEVTGLDLVELQLRVASGERLGLAQDDVRLDGHAVEARVYAEDPSRGFLPTGGRAVVVREPAGPGIRVDSGLVEGLDVPTTYDPMLSKVVAHGPDRATALARLQRAVAETVVLGFATNLRFLAALLHHPDVESGDLDTGLIERALPDLVGGRPPAALYAAWLLHRLAVRWPSGPVVDPWDVPSGWRPGVHRPLESVVVGPDGEPLALAVRGRPDDAAVRIGDGAWRPASIAVGAAARADLAARPGGGAGDDALVSLDGTTRRVVVAASGPTTWVWIDGGAWPVNEVTVSRAGARRGATEREIRSPMPGTVIAVPVRPGEQVVTGQAVLVIEAMKMEHTLNAPADGAVELLARVGDTVGVDQVVARVEGRDGDGDGDGAER